MNFGPLWKYSPAHPWGYKQHALYNAVQKVIVLYDLYHGKEQRSWCFIEDMVEILCGEQHEVSLAVGEIVEDRSRGVKRQGPS